RWVSPVQTVVAEEAALPDGYQLAQNYPNPFNTETTISFTLLESTPVELAVYNTSGQKVRTLVEGERAAGEHRMIWNGRDDKGAPVASGRYVAKMAGAGFAREMGMTLLK
ncbi:MAG: T9SS type A sorting domain-containing protein, partial [Candidatus Latescibacteria bacterium]|nr:T9SS type A sorting domain-containing protein [Candidatus Latescibacterota bacterium]